MKKQTIVIVLVILSILCLSAFLLERQTKIVHRLLDVVVYDNRNHYLPCEKLPTELEASQIVEKHPEIIHQIEQVGPDVKVEIDTFTCPGKADLVIWYPSHQNRLAIEEIIAGETLFGIPYRLRNR